MSEENNPANPASPQFRSRQGVPANRRVYPIAVHNQVDFNPTPEQQQVVEDTKPTPCFRCGAPMLKKDIFGSFDGNAVCKPCYEDLERAEQAGELDDDYVNTPNLAEEKAEQKAQEEKEKKANPEGDKKEDPGMFEGLFSF